MFWARAADGVRIRAGRWGQAPFALVLTGRSEHLEKYAPVAERLEGLGFGMLCLDWRGQGLSDRQTPDNLGYVRRFTDYQHDIDAVLGASGVALAEIPLLVAHSAGGLASLRYLRRSSHVRAAVQSGPMFGLKRQGPLDPLLYGVVRIAARLGLGHMLLPGSTRAPTVIAREFDDNPLTRSRARWDSFHHQIATRPELGVGGMTLGWVAASIAEVAKARRWPPIDRPMLVLLGASEDVVSIEAITSYVSASPTAELEVIPDAEHEVLMEGPKTEAIVWDRIAGFLAQHDLS